MKCCIMNRVHSIIYSFIIVLADMQKLKDKRMYKPEQRKENSQVNHQLQTVA